MEELLKRGKKEQEEIDFFSQTDPVAERRVSGVGLGDKEQEVHAAQLDPMYYEAPPYPKELLDDEQVEVEKIRKAADNERRRKTRKLSVTDINKKMVSQIISNGMVEGRKVWTEEEIVQRDLYETIDSFKKKRDGEKFSAKKDERRASQGGLTLDDRLAVEKEQKIVVVDDDEYDPREEVEGGARGGGIGKVRREFRHSWSRPSLIEMARDAEMDMKQEEREKTKGYMGPTMILNNEDPMKPFLLDEMQDGEGERNNKRTARRRFSTEDRVLDEMVIQPVIKKKNDGGEVKAGRRSFRKSFRKSMDALARLTGIVDDDMRKIHIGDPASHPMNWKRPETSGSRRRRRPSLDLQPNLRHLVSKEHKERLDAERPATVRQIQAITGVRRKSRLSFDSAKQMVRTVGTFIKNVTENKEAKKEKNDQFIASVKINLFVMRVMRKYRREASAKRIQKCWRGYRHAVIVERWMIVAGWERNERVRMETREEKVRLQEEKERKAEKRTLRKAAIKAAQKAPGGYVKPPKGKKAKEEIINRGWQKKDDALMLAIQYKYGLPTSYKDPKMDYYRVCWETKPPKLIFKRIELLYKSDTFDEMTDDLLDHLTEEQREKYCPGFGTMQMLAQKDNWGRTGTDFDYRNRKQGGKFIKKDEKIANMKSKYEYNSEGELESDEEDVKKRKNPISRVKIG